jgi:hypothetical protein
MFAATVAQPGAGIYCPDADLVVFTIDEGEAIAFDTGPPEGRPPPPARSVSWTDASDHRMA